MMNFRISRKVFAKNFRYSFHRFLSVQQNSIKCSSNSYHTCDFDLKNENRVSYIPVSRQVGRKTLCSAPLPVFMNFQSRNISHDAVVSDNVDNLLPAASDLSSADSAAELAARLPSFIKNCSDWQIVELAQNALLQVHETTGLPWWASISLTAIMARALLTLPFSLVQIRTAAKLQMIVSGPELAEAAKRIKAEVMHGSKYYHWPESLVKRAYTLKMKKEYDALIVRENCHPAKAYILALIQIPLWFSFSVATRNLCFMLPRPDISAQITFMEMSVGGFGWVSNLAIPDPYMILPITLGIVNLSLIEIHHMFRPVPISTFERILSYFVRFVTAFMVLIAAQLPAGTSVYWLSSSLFGVLQAFVTNSPRLRRLCRIPIVKTELEHPYRHFYGKLKSRLSFASK